MRILLTAILVLLVFVGCFALPVEEHVSVVVLNTASDPRPLRTVAVTRGDVVSFSNPSAIYVPAQVAEMAFQEAGRRIIGIYVSVGDVVREGDILAELERPDAFVGLDDFKREEEWMELELAQLNDRHELALLHAERTKIPVDDFFYLEEQEHILNRLEILRMRIEHQQEEIESMYLRAPFDGVVTQSVTFTGEMTSNLHDVLVTVADQSQYIFLLTGAEAESMIPGQYYDMNIGGDLFHAVVVESSSSEALLEIVGNTPILVGQTFASVHIVADEARNVLNVPNISISTVGGRSFVYVAEDGLRTVRYIETGVVGNAVTEVIWGLHEGEFIVY